MPRRRWRLRDRREPLTPELRTFLERGAYGDSAVDMFSFGMFQLTARILRGEWAHVAPLWQAHGEEIMVDWTVARPGTRPAAWWWLDATEPRAIAHGHALVMSPSVLADHLWRRQLGVPAFEQVRPRAYIGLPSVESQAAHLDRLKLLDAAERAALLDDAFEDEMVNPFIIDAEDIDRLIGYDPRRAL